MRSSYADAVTVPSNTLVQKADACMAALKEARRLVDVRIYGPLLGHLVTRSLDYPPRYRAPGQFALGSGPSRSCEMLDEIDEILIGLHPGRDHLAFERAAALHRELEHLQSLIPREHRLPQRRKGGGPKP